MDTTSEVTSMTEEKSAKTVAICKAEKKELQKKIVEITRDIAMLCIYEGDAHYRVDTIESCQQAIACYKEAMSLLTVEEKMSLLGLFVLGRMQQVDNTLDELYRSTPNYYDDPLESDYSTYLGSDMYDDT